MSFYSYRTKCKICKCNYFLFMDRCNCFYYLPRLEKLHFISISTLDYPFLWMIIIFSINLKLLPLLQWLNVMLGFVFNISTVFNLNIYMYCINILNCSGFLIIIGKRNQQSLQPLYAFLPHKMVKRNSKSHLFCYVQFCVIIFKLSSCNCLSTHGQLIHAVAKLKLNSIFEVNGRLEQYQ